jgi:hypothetical protein
MADTILSRAQSRVTKERNTDDHETENPQSTGGQACYAQGSAEGSSA